MDKFDLIIIGKGPAGISGAIYAKRAELSVAVIGAGAGALEFAEKIENYYGLPMPVSGMEIFENGITQAKELGISVINEEAFIITKETLFCVKTSSGEYYSKAVLLAVGKKRKTSQIEGLDEFRGKGVSFCAVCDGFFYRKKKLALIGAGNYALSELSELLHVTSDITLFTNGHYPPENIPEGVLCVKDKIVSINGTERVNSIKTTEAEYAIDGVFVAEGVASAADFAAKMGIFEENGYIKVDENYMTSIDGVYAAGDCIGGFLQISKAVSDGAKAAMAIIAAIRKNGKGGER